MSPIDRFINCGKRRYFSPAALSLVEETGIGDPIRAIEQLACDLVSEAEVEKPPVPLRKLASLVGVIDIQEADMRGAARLEVLGPHAFRIRVSASDDPGRQNFSIGHEIGHLLIPSYHETPVVIVDAVTGEFLQEHEEELFCDIASRSLLLPEGMFRAECAKLNKSVDSLIALANLFSCSLEAVALRTDQLSVWDCVPVVWEMGLKPSQASREGALPLLGMEDLSRPREEFRVKFHAGKDDTLFFPRHKHVAADNPMVAGCLADGRFTGNCALDTGKRWFNCLVDARLVPFYDAEGRQRQRIISLVSS